MPSLQSTHSTHHKMPSLLAKLLKSRKDTQTRSLPCKAPSDAPPPYTPAPLPSSHPRTTSHRVPIVESPTQDDQEDPYAFLATFDTIFLIDDSGSMRGDRWRQVNDALATIAPICTAHDADGIDVAFLNHRAGQPYTHLTSAAAVRSLFQTVSPAGATPTGTRLDGLLRPYLARYAAAAAAASESGVSTTTTTAAAAVKPVNVICITDGTPTDDLEASLIGIARRLDRLDAPAWQIGVQFVQVGRDPRAAARLAELDDGLARLAGDAELRDMVDTVPFTGPMGGALTGEGVMKVVLGAVNRRLDRGREGAELYRV